MAKNITSVQFNTKNLIDCLLNPSSNIEFTMFFLLKVIHYYKLLIVLVLSPPIHTLNIIVMWFFFIRS